MTFKNKVHWNSLYNKVPHAWFQPARGTAEENYKYVRKIDQGDGVMPNPDHTFFEQGLRPNFEAGN